MNRTLWGLCAAILLVALAWVSAAESVPSSREPVRLEALKAVPQSRGTRLEAQTSGPFRYTSYQPDAQTLVVDLVGVVAEPGTVSLAGELGWLKEYRLLPFRNASGRDILRLELLLAQDCAVEVAQPNTSLLAASCGESAREAQPAPTRPETMASAPLTLPEGDPVEVRNVDIAENREGVTIEIEASGPLPYETLTLENPSRLVVDLPQSLLLAPTRKLTVERRAVLGVRMSQFKLAPPVTRVVVDLLWMVPYEIEARDDGLRLILKNPGAAGPRPSLVSPSAVSLTELSPARMASPSTGQESEPAPILVASLAPTLPSSMAATAKPALPYPVSPPAAVEVAQATPATAPPVPPAPQVAAESAPQAQPPPRQFTGEPISVNLKDVDLKDFFRLIHEISGLNIVLDPNVSGTVTLVLIDVPWDQALDIVLRNNGLDKTLEGNVLRIATLETLKKEQEETRDLARARAEAVDPVDRTWRLSYAKSSEMEATLRRFLSSRGELIRDDRTNTIIIRDIPTVIPTIDNLIKQLDRKSLQVEIEARVVSATRTFTRELGSQLAVAFAYNGGRGVVGGALGPSPFTSFFPPPLVAGTPPAPGTAAAVAQPLVTDLRAVSPTSGILYAFRSTNFALDAILTAAEQRNIAKVLSKPRVVTQNNVSATVKQGTRIPIQTVVNNTISTQFIDVVLELRVKPQITAEGTVFLDIHVENTQIDEGIARINGIPALATQAADTQVLVGDGGTVVIGGVMVTNHTTTIDQVPLLGSVPIIGYLFKRSRVNTNSQELLFFITPRILQS